MGDHDRGRGRHPHHGNDDHFQNEQKYLLLKVPNFAKDIAGDPDAGAASAHPHRDRYDLPMTSYLRLGASAVDRQPGDDLVPYAFTAGAAGMLEFTGDDSGWPTETDTAWIDDDRNRGEGNVEPGGAAGHGIPLAKRKEWYTRHLMARGGWRDHSDGNRISTTYGDKVEVIRGNYKMVVLGRQDDPEFAMGWDASGNHIQDFAQATMPGASVTTEWIQNAYLPDSPSADYAGGAWLLINSTERVYEYARNAGNFREQKWGRLHETYTGSENPEDVGTSDGAGYDGHPYDPASHVVSLTPEEFGARIRPSSVGLPRGNPHIIEKTWAEKIEGYTGSAAWRIPEIYEETWAEKVESKTDVLGTVTETTTVVGAVTTTTAVVGAVTETTAVAGLVTETTTTGGTLSTSIHETVTEITSVNGPSTSVTKAGAITEVTGAGVITGVTTAGATLDLTAAGAILEGTIAGLKGTLDLTGVLLELAVTIGKVSINVTPIALEVFTGIKFEFEASGGKKITTDGEEVTLSKGIKSGKMDIKAAIINLN